MRQQEQEWDSKAEVYLDLSRKDITGVFAYEKYINTSSLFSLFPKSAQTVLDLGCGIGCFTNELTKKFSKVVGVDVSGKMLNIAKGNAERAIFIKHDLETPLPDFKIKYDLITAKLVLMYIEDLDLFAKECSHALKIGGNMLVSITHPTRWLVKFLEKKKNNQRFARLQHLFTGYFSETYIDRRIGGPKGVTFTFIHRTLQTYVNVFRRHGLILDLVDEPTVPDAFLLEYPKYSEKMDIPLRLNFRLVKK